MMIKRNKCPNCGAPRLKGSVFCAYCLLAENKKLRGEVASNYKKMVDLTIKNNKLTDLVNRLLDQIINDKVMNSEPYIRLRKSVMGPVKGD